MYLQKVISKKTFFLNIFFVGILNVNDENNRIRTQIHTKMSWIRNTVHRWAFATVAVVYRRVPIYKT